MLYHGISFLLAISKRFIYRTLSFAANKKQMRTSKSLTRSLLSTNLQDPKLKLPPVIIKIMHFEMLYSNVLFELCTNQAHVAEIEKSLCAIKKEIEQFYILPFKSEKKSPALPKKLKEHFHIDYCSRPFFASTHKPLLTLQHE